MQKKRQIKTNLKADVLKKIEEGCRTVKAVTLKNSLPGTVPSAGNRKDNSQVRKWSYTRLAKPIVIEY